MYMLVGPVDQVFGSINLLVLPILASCFSLQQFSRFRKLWKAYLTLFLLIGLSYAGLAVVAGHKGIHLLYGGKFDDVAGLFALMGLLPIVMGVGNTINVALKAAERPDSVFYAYLASGSATLVVGVPLVIRLGLRGAIWGMLVSAVMYTLVLAVQFVLVGRTLHEPASLRLASDEGSA
jgi:O-antigen/teichoic acid export membrane protein